MFARGSLLKFFLLLFCYAYTALPLFAAPADTSAKKPQVSIGRSAFDITLSSANFQEAIRALKADSMDKALHMLAPFLRESERVNHISRMSAYTELLLTRYVLDAEEGKLSAGERQVLGALIKIGITRNEQDYKDIRKILGNLSPTPFVDHMRLLVLSGLNDDKAAKEADKILREYPDDLEVNLQKAQWLYDKERYDESVTYCTRVIQLFPQSAFAYDLRGKCYNMLSKPDEAIADFENVTKLYPANKLVNYHKAMALMDKEKYRKAVTSLLISQEADPDYVWTHYNLARCYNKLNMPDSAFFYINLHINDYPSDDDGYALKGDVYCSKEDYLSAIGQYNEALRISPKKAEFYEDRGDAYYYQQKYDDALSDFLQAIKLDKHREYAAKRAGDTYYEMGIFDKALQYQQSSIAIDPKYKYGYVSLCMTKIAQSDFSSAVDYGKKAVEIDSTFDTGLGNLGWAYYCAGDNDSCILYSYKALKYDSTATYAMFNIALATLKKGEIDKAKALYKQFIDECSAKGYTINDGAIDDLKNLMKKNIAVEDCKYVIQQLFGKQLE